MNISAWDVYWVMQMDRISWVASNIAGFSLALGAIAVMAWVATGFLFGSCGEGTVGRRVVQRTKMLSIVLCSAAVMGHAACAFLPSTTTLATAYILPEIANSETLREECSELYDIAKSGLRKMAGVEGEESE